MTAESQSCPRCSVPLRGVDFGDVSVEFCRVCRGGFTSQDSLSELLGHALEGASQGPTTLGDMDECVRCGSPVIRNEHPENTWFSCASCDGAWLEAGEMARLHATRQGVPRPGGTAATATVSPLPGSSRPPSVSPEVPPSSQAPPVPAGRAMPGASAPLPNAEDESGFISSRIPYDLPLVQYFALPIAAVAGLLFGVVGLARPPVFFVQIWFHEVGHAVPAWLSSRAALPLPFGFTFWKEESSWFTAVCLLFLIGVFAYTSLRERRYYGVIASFVMFGCWAFFTLVLDPYEAIGWILFGGLAGELVLTTLAIVSFYYRAPDRMRWDFWRFIVLVPAMTAFVTSFAMWVRIHQGTQGLPMGSIIGAPGDGTGDIERMLAGYAWTAETLTTAYRSIGTLCLLVIVTHYVVFAIRARVAPPPPPPPAPKARG